MDSIKNYKRKTSVRDNATLACIGCNEHLKKMMLITLQITFYATNAYGQIKPAGSGDPSYYEPEMVKHGSRFKHPNEIHLQRRRLQKQR